MRSADGHLHLQSAIKLNHSNDNQQCGQFIRAWNEPSYNSTELRVCSTILIRASRDLDGLTFECQDGTNGSDDVPTSYGRTALSVISVPDNPRITHVNSDNPTVLTIEWSPAENGSLPNLFNITISIFGVSVPLSTASVAFEDGRLLPYSYTFTGLTSDTDYNVSVVSINCAGISSSVDQARVKTGRGRSITLLQLKFGLKLTDANGEKQTLNVIRRAIKEYKNLGMLLLNDKNCRFVKTLERKHRNDPQEITEEIFGTWIENKGPTPVDWGALIGVFQQVELNALADEIQGALANADP
eukprot:Em0008g845a